MRPPVLPPSLLDGIAGWARKMTFASAQGTLGFVQPGPRDVSIAVRAIDVIEKREEDLVVGRKMRIQHHVEQANVLCGG